MKTILNKEKTQAELHQEEIVSTRKGGFGGSDSDIFLRVGKNGLQKLTESDKRRIAIAKGIVKYSPIPATDSMKKGHEFETFCWEKIFSTMQNTKKEFKLEKELTKNFKTFAHADFIEIVRGKEINVIECKYTKYPKEAENKYIAQLQWYYLLGASYVELFVGDANKEMKHGNIDCVYIQKDEEIINHLLNGIKIISDNWENKEIFTIKEEITEENLLPFEVEVVNSLYNCLTKIKQLESEADTYRKALLSLFEDNNIKYLKSERYNISYVGKTYRNIFDKKSLQKEHPEINLEKFNKISEVPAMLKIKMEGGSNE